MVPRVAWNLGLRSSNAIRGLNPFVRVAARIAPARTNCRNAIGSVPSMSNSTWSILDQSILSIWRIIATDESPPRETFPTLAEGPDAHGRASGTPS